MNRSSVLCPSCRRLISRDESHCPYCGIRKPGRWWRQLLAIRRFEDPQNWLRGLIILNVGMYVMLLLFNRQGPGMSLNPMSALAPDSESLLLLGATGTIPIDRLHRWWSLVSASFLHGNLIHILFNMLALSQIGPLMLNAFGVYRTTIIYVVGGAAGFLVSYAAGVGFTIGASASICSLVGAILFYSHHRGGVFGRVLFRQVGGWVVVMIVFGLIIPGINNWGHGGGLVAGAILALILGYEEQRVQRYWHRIAGLGSAVGAAVILCWAVGSAVWLTWP